MSNDAKTTQKEPQVKAFTDAKPTLPKFADAPTFGIEFPDPEKGAALRADFTRDTMRPGEGI